jgi:hypothetical protein
MLMTPPHKGWLDTMPEDRQIGAHFAAVLNHGDQVDVALPNMRDCSRGGWCEQIPSFALTHLAQLRSVERVDEYGTFRVPMPISARRRAVGARDRASRERYWPRGRNTVDGEQDTYAWV